jgi:molybdenum cofactor biosynthesis protein B
MTDETQQASGVTEHRALAPDRLRVAVLTVSDTRDVAGDASGGLIRSLLAEAGHVEGGYHIVPDDPGAIVARVQEWVADPAIDVLILTGGTGIARRDRTPETLAAIFDRTLDGFGELFRMLSYQEVGSAALLSRATAGVIDTTPVFALPGSKNAVALAMKQLILPEIGHIVFEVRK